MSKTVQSKRAYLIPALLTHSRVNSEIGHRVCIRIWRHRALIIQISEGVALYWSSCSVALFKKRATV